MASTYIDYEGTYLCPTSFNLDAVRPPRSNEELKAPTIADFNSWAINEHYSSNSLYHKIHSKNAIRLEVKWLRTKPVDNKLDEQHEALIYDSRGGTLLHQCFEYKKFDMVKWIVAHFPKFGLKSFRFGVAHNINAETILPYGGQNVLHLAILAGNYSMAKWLLEFYSRHSMNALRDLLFARVNTHSQGSYFCKDGPHYFGELPLHFAVCMDNMEMVDLILQFVSLLSDGTVRNLLYVPDCHGNNVVHLCVLRGHRRMFEHIKYLAMEMLQQELMTVLHQRIFDGPPSKEADNIYKPPNVVYDGDSSVFGPVTTDLFRFRGHIRQLSEIRLPSSETQKQFFAAQVYRWVKSVSDKEKLLNSISPKDQATSVVLMELLGSQDPNKTHHKAIEREGLSISRQLSNSTAERSSTRILLNHLMKDKNFQSPDCETVMSSSLKQQLTLWMYGAERGGRSGAISRLFKELFILGINEDGHSPVTLAASQKLDKVAILRDFISDTVIKSDRDYEFDATGVEFALPKKAKHPTDNRDIELYSPPIGDNVILRSAISYISHNDSCHEIIDCIPEINWLLKEKWKRMEIQHKDQFTDEFYCTFAGVVLLCFMNWFDDQRFIERVIFAFAFGLKILPRLSTWFEIAEEIWRNPQVLLSTHFSFLPNVSSWRLIPYFRETAWVSFSLCTVLYFVWEPYAVIPLRVSLFLMSIACILDGMLYHEGFGALLMTVKRVIFHDVKNFLFLYLAVAVVFLVIFDTLFDLKLNLAVQLLSADPPADIGIWTNLFSSAPYAIVVSLIFTNLVVAVMTNTYGLWNDEKEWAKAKLRCERNIFMVAWMQDMSEAEREIMVKKYCYKRPEFAISPDNEADTHSAYYFKVPETFDTADKRAQESLKLVQALERATIESNEELITLSRSDVLDSYQLSQEGLSIFHPDYWLNEDGKHPQPGQRITFSDVNNFKFKPVDRSHIDYCRYATNALEKVGKVIEIGHHKRVVALILHPQNDFSDRVAGLYERKFIRVEEKRRVDIFDGTDSVRCCNVRGHERVYNIDDKEKGSIVPDSYDGDSVYVAFDDGISYVSISSLRYLPETVEAMWQDVLRESINRPSNTRKVYHCSDPRRKGTLVGMKLRTVDGEPMVEILWDADVYQSSELMLEGSTFKHSGWRGYERLKYAMENKLRVYHKDDVRPVRYQDPYVESVRPRFGIVESIRGVDDVSVVWDFSVPSLHKMDELNFVKVDRYGRFSSGVTMLDPMSHIKGEGKAVRHLVINGTDYVEVFWERDNKCGNLPVPGANEDFDAMQRVIAKNWGMISEVFISRDCHQCDHISNKSFWKKGDMTPRSSKGVASKQHHMYDQIVTEAEAISSLTADDSAIPVGSSSSSSGGGGGNVPDHIACMRGLVINGDVATIKSHLTDYPTDFEPIGYVDVITGRYLPRDSHKTGYVLSYLWQLWLGSNKHEHIIWPTHAVVRGNLVDFPLEKDATEKWHRHCAETDLIEIGDADRAIIDEVASATRGHDIDYRVRAVLREWISRWKLERKVQKKIHLVDIGYNTMTETYSVFKSEVQNFTDPSTGLNQGLLRNLNFPNTEILVFGEALSHVVRCSMEDLIKKTTLPASSISLVLTCTSIVPGFLIPTMAFIEKLLKHGVKIQLVNKDSNLEPIDTSDTDSALIDIARVIGRHASNAGDLKKYLKKKGMEETDVDTIVDDLAIVEYAMPGEDVLVELNGQLEAAKENGYLKPFFLPLSFESVAWNDVCDGDFRTILSRKCACIPISVTYLSEIQQLQENNIDHIGGRRDPIIVLWVALLLYLHGKDRHMKSTRSEPMRRSSSHSLQSLLSSKSVSQSFNVTPSAVGRTYKLEKVFSIYLFDHAEGNDEHNRVSWLPRGKCLPEGMVEMFSYIPVQCVLEAMELIKSLGMSFDGEMYDYVKGLTLIEIIRDLMKNSADCEQSSSISECLKSNLHLETYDIKPTVGIRNMGTRQLVEYLNERQMSQFVAGVMVNNLDGMYLADSASDPGMFAQYFNMLPPADRLELRKLFEDAN